MKMNGWKSQEVRKRGEFQPFGVWGSLAAEVDQVSPTVTSRPMQKWLTTFPPSPLMNVALVVDWLIELLIELLAVMGQEKFGQIGWRQWIRRYWGKLEITESPISCFSSWWCFFLSFFLTEFLPVSPFIGGMWESVAAVALCCHHKWPALYIV